MHTARLVNLPPHYIFWTITPGYGLERSSSHWLRQLCWAWRHCAHLELPYSQRQISRFVCLRGTFLESHSLDVFENADGVSFGHYLVDGRMALLLPTFLCESHSARPRLESFPKHGLGHYSYQARFQALPSNTPPQLCELSNYFLKNHPSIIQINLYFLQQELWLTHQIWISHFFYCQLDRSIIWCWITFYISDYWESHLLIFCWPILFTVLWILYPLPMFEKDFFTVFKKGWKYIRYPSASFYQLMCSFLWPSPI